MAVTYPLTPPSNVKIVRHRQLPTNVVAVTASAFTLEERVHEHEGKQWRFEVTLPAMKYDGDAVDWASFLLKCKGRRGTFLWGDPDRRTPRGSASSAPGTPVVDGAGQTGEDLNIRGAPALATNYLRAMDYIQLGSGSTARLYAVLDDVNTDSSGDATLTVWPKVTADVSPGDGATVTLTNPVGVFRMDEDYGWDSDHVKRHSVTFSCHSVV